MKARYSEQSIETRRYALAPFFASVGKLPEDITLADIENHRSALLNENKDTMANCFCSHMKQFMRWLDRFDISEKIVYKRLAHNLPTVLNQYEMSQLVQASKKNPKHYAIVMLFIYTGVRLSELTNINVGDIDFVSKTIHIREGKGCRDRMVVFGYEVQHALDEYLKTKPTSVALFPSSCSERISNIRVYQIIKAIAKDAGITKNVHPHTLRHSFATALLSNDADIRHIQTMLGHRNISSTQLYTHVDTTDIARVYDRAKPKL